MAVTRPAERTQVDEFAAAAPKPPTQGKLRGRKRLLTLTLPPDLVETIDAIAAEEDRSRAKIVEYALRQYAESHRRREAA